MIKPGCFSTGFQKVYDRTRINIGIGKINHVYKLEYIVQLGTVLLLQMLALSISASCRVRYVSGTATGLNNGTSWANAFTVFDSICTYKRDTVILDTFWVANGIYKPRTTNGWTMANNGLKVYGGFLGAETSLSQRVWSSFQTVLDGDIGTIGVNTDNCVNILRLNGSTGTGVSFIPAFPSFRLDGFKFSSAYLSNVSNPNNNTGGAGLCYLYGHNDSLVIENCLFTQNASVFGGAILFTNWTTVPGPSMCKVINCRFENNMGWRHGGAITTQSAAPIVSLGGFVKLTISDCSFSNNTAAFGGAVANLDSAVDVTITRCTFRGNTASVSGGALYDSSVSKTRVYNSLIIGNSAPLSCAYHCNPAPTGTTAKPHKLFHCTIASNKSTSTSSSDYALILNGKDSISNCIFWDNTTGSGKQIASPVGVNYINTNVIQGGVANTTNTYTFNPLFLGAGIPASAPFPITATYNYGLRAMSSAIDTGITTLIAPAGINNLDLAGNSRLFGPCPDLGAYEKTYCNAVTPQIAPASVAPRCAPDSVLLTGYGYWNNAPNIANTIWAKDSGMYQLISGSDSSGCRAKNSVLVTIYPKPNPVITSTNNTLGTASPYGTYQWYKGGVLIPGATSATYSPSSNGVYKVVVTSSPGGCKDSTTYNLTNLGVWTAGALLSGVHIYPNPAAHGRFTLRLSASPTLRSVHITLSDAVGRPLYKRILVNIGSNYEHEISIPSAAAGIYLLHIEADGELLTRRVVLQ